MDIAQSSPYLFRFSAFESAEETAQRAVLGDGINIVRQVDMTESRSRKRTIQELEQLACVLIQQGHLQTAVMTQNGVLGSEAVVLVPLGVITLFGTGDEEERVIYDIRTDDRFSFRGLLHLHRPQVGQDDIITEFAVRDNNHVVVFQGFFIRCICNTRCSFAVSVAKPSDDVLDHFV